MADRDGIVRYSCKQCGCSFERQFGRGAKPKFCSAACRQAAWRANPSPPAPRNNRIGECAAQGCSRTIFARRVCVLHYQRLRTFGSFEDPKAICPHCGEEFLAQTRGRKFCSKKCLQISSARKRGKRPLSEYKQAISDAAIKIVCEECGKSFRPTRSGNHRNGVQRCCSNECANAPRRRLFAIKNELQRWGKAERSRLRAISKLQRAVVSFQVRLCACGRSLEKNKRLCSDCAATRKADQRNNAPSRRADKAMRKALSRGKVDGAERFDPLEVLARDGWRCHICGVSTPKRLRGTFDDRAPELDHIIPLAAGGEHTRLNTACACRKCNIAKSNKPLGQLRLVA